MRKLMLELESLHVESFDTVAARGSERGTVRGAESNEFTYLTCAPCGTGGLESGSFTCGCVTVTCDPNSGNVRCFNNTNTDT